MSFLYQQKLMPDVTQRNKNGRDTEINKVNMLLTNSLYNFFRRNNLKTYPLCFT